MKKKQNKGDVRADKFSLSIMCEVFTSKVNLLERRVLPSMKWAYGWNDLTFIWCIKLVFYTFYVLMRFNLHSYINCQCPGLNLRHFTIFAILLGSYFFRLR
jgi:hypothetical protein